MNDTKHMTTNYEDDELLAMVVTELNALPRGWDAVTQHHGSVHLTHARLHNARMEGLTAENEFVQVLVVVWGGEEWLPLSLRAYDLQQEVLVRFMIPEYATPDQIPIPPGMVPDIGPETDMDPRDLKRIIGGAI